MSVSRRSVVRTAVWSAPAVTVVSAAPAFAASGAPTLTATWDANSYRGTTTSAPASAGINLQVHFVATGGTLSKIAVVVTSQAGGDGHSLTDYVTPRNNGGASTVTWNGFAADLTANGWTTTGSTPPVPVTTTTNSTQEKTRTFLRTLPGSAFSFKVSLNNASAGTDYPLTLTATGYYKKNNVDTAISPAKVVTVSANQVTSPYVTAIVS